jgi:DNA helicase-2/ATP-dependent DNA helicase PcrA
VVNVPTRGVGAKTQTELRNDAVKRGQPLLATARIRARGTSAPEKGLAAFVQAVDELADVAREEPIHVLIERLVERTGYRQMLEEEGAGGDREAEREARGRLENVDALIQDARAFEPPPGVTAPLDGLTAWLDRVALTADVDDLPDGGEVTMLTAHSAKGLEFKVVFVVQMNEGVFPHERSAESGLEEERRLAYVAFTRAMERLVVTRSLTDLFGKIAMPSRFLFGVPTEVLDGDLPDGEPSQGELEKRLADAAVTTTKLATFLEHRRQRAAVPEGVHTLIEIESAEQLVRGVRILHPRHGVGEIRHVVGRKLQVAFGERQITVDATADLRIVGD